jgi:hypothetical protein
VCSSDLSSNGFSLKSGSYAKRWVIREEAAQILPPGG